MISKKKKPKHAEPVSSGQNLFHSDLVVEGVLLDGGVGLCFPVPRFFGTILFFLLFRLLLFRLLSRVSFDL
jgi:hypothetical protein